MKRKPLAVKFVENNTPTAKIAAQNLSKTIIESCIEFFKDPQNEKDFRKWKELRSQL